MPYGIKAIILNYHKDTQLKIFYPPKINSSLKKKKIQSHKTPHGCKEIGNTIFIENSNCILENSLK